MKSPVEFGIPPHMAEALVRYVEHGVPVGNFLQAVLSNDLKAAVGYADDCNIHLLKEYVQWMYNECPSPAQGSLEKYLAWIRWHQASREASERARSAFSTAHKAHYGSQGNAPATDEADRGGDSTQGSGTAGGEDAQADPADPAASPDR